MNVIVVSLVVAGVARFVVTGTMGWLVSARRWLLRRWPPTGAAFTAEDGAAEMVGKREGMMIGDEFIVTGGTRVPFLFPLLCDKCCGFWLGSAVGVVGVFLSNDWWFLTVGWVAYWANTLAD